jgi:hypothetical protein
MILGMSARRLAADNLIADKENPYGRHFQTKVAGQFCQMCDMHLSIPHISYTCC